MRGRSDSQVSGSPSHALSSYYCSLYRITAAPSHDMISFFHSCCVMTFKRKRDSRNQTTLREVLGNSRSSHLQLFSLNDLLTATGGFHRDNELGHGGFGIVYKGKLRDGRLIAVKKLSLGSRQGKDEFVNEVRLLATVQHRNLIKLYGCCAEEFEKLLVYEYLPNGSLDKHLFDQNARSKLDWCTRRGIILGTAKGLTYLHEDSRLRMVHRDIKPNNILLDDSFAPKISDFGVARLFSNDQTHVSTKMVGTYGYVAPEYALHGKLSEKADIFSFGVVTLEIISGRKNGDSQQKQLLLELAWTLYMEQRLLELVDPKIMTAESTSNFADEVRRVAHIALLCTQADASLRPPMSKVVLLLCGQSPIPQTPTRPAYLENTYDHRTGGGSSSNSSRVPHIDNDASVNFSCYTESFVGSDDTQIDPR